jgi:hypothetical protein
MFVDRVMQIWMMPNPFFVSQDRINLVLKKNDFAKFYSQV